MMTVGMTVLGQSRYQVTSAGTAMYGTFLTQRWDLLQVRVGKHGE